MKVFRAIGVLVISSLVITSSFAAVRNITPVVDPLDMCATGAVCGGGSGSCPDVIMYTTTDDQGHCRSTKCYLNGYSTRSDGTVTCWYDCTYDYCTVA